MVISRSKSANAKASPAKTTTKTAASSNDQPAATEKPGWTFLTNHAHVLLLLSQHPSMVLREVAVKTGITERAVQRIITDLELDGFLERERIGRQNRYKIKPQLALRHPIESHRSVGDLIDMIVGDH
jgi:predicted transcriptional regulator